MKRILSPSGDFVYVGANSMKKAFLNGINYTNGYFRTGKIDKKFKAFFKKNKKTIPKCDTLFLTLKEGDGTVNNFTFTRDEFLGIIMLMSETYWHTEKRVKR